MTYFYRCYLTGDGEDPPVSDLELPIESFQSRYRSGDPSYLQVVVPDALTYADGVNARLNGDIVVHRGQRTEDGTEYPEEILRVNLEDIRVDWGARSASMTLTGHKQTTNTTPTTVAMTGVSYRAAYNGTITIRCLANSYLRPGDTAEFAATGDSFTVGNITWTVGRGIEQMEIQELDA